MRRVADLTVLRHMRMLSVGGRLLPYAHPDTRGGGFARLFQAAAARGGLWQHVWPRTGRVRLMALPLFAKEFMPVRLQTIITVQRRARRWLALRRSLAVAMALHPRLGAAAAVSTLGADVLALLLH